MRSRTLVIIVLGLAALVFGTAEASAQCLQCASGWQPPAGHGPASSTDPRRKINIFIDWGNPTPDKIWNAVVDAVNSWNNATDQYGEKTAYYFVIDQSKSIANPPDLTIRNMGSGTSVEFRSLAPGTYWVSANSAPVTTADDNLSRGGSVVDVSPVKATAVDIPLAQGGNITGRVIVEGVSTGVQTVSSRSTVNIRYVDGCQDSASSGIVKDRFIVTGVAPGNVLISLENLPPRWFVKGIAFDGDDSSRALPEIVQGRTHSVVVTISRDGATLSGQALDSKARPKTDAAVIIMPRQGTIREKLADNVRFRIVRVDPYGAYVVKSLPPGDYLVGVVPERDCAKCTDPTYLTAVSSKFERTTLRPSSTTIVNLQDKLNASLLPQEDAIESGHGPFVSDDEPNQNQGKGSAIQGVVTDEYGEPITGMPMRLAALDPDGRPKAVRAHGQGTVTTDDRGLFRFFGLLPGRYIVVAVPSGRLGAAVDPKSVPRDPASHIDDRRKYVPTLYPGTYRITADGIIELREGEEKSVSFGLSRVRTALITGAIQLPTHLSSASVRLIPNTALPSLLSVQQTTTEEHFGFADIPPGEYSIVATSGSPAEGTWSAAQRLTVQGGDVRSDILLPLRPPATVSGAVRFPAAAIPENAFVQFTSAEPNGNQGILNAIPLDRLGRFNSTSLPAGSYTIRVFVRNGSTWSASAARTSDATRSQATLELEGGDAVENLIVTVGSAVSANK